MTEHPAQSSRRSASEVKAEARRMIEEAGAVAEVDYQALIRLGRVISEAAAKESARGRMTAPRRREE